MLGMRQLRRLDWPVVIALIALLVFGWPYMNSASYRSGPDGQGYTTSSPQKQVVWIVVGIVLALLLLAPSYRTFSELSLLLYLGGLAMLVMVMLFGRVINGAKSWIVLPANMRLQPSELVKITTLLALAQYLGPEKRPRTMGRVIAAFGIAAVPVLMIAAQPDLGTAMMFIPATIAMVFVAGARLKHLGLLAAAVVVLMPVAWLGMNDTQRSRVTTWVQQDRPLTRAERVGRFHHLIQSKVAIGSGGWTGKGLGKGTQNKLNYLGFRNTDFVFAVICEEAGFLGANVVILFYLVIAGAGLSIAQSCREPVGRLIAVGVVALLLAQGFVNIAMTLGLLPIVGVTLPFVSYGGSSTLSSFIAVSLLLNVGLRRPRITFAREELGIAAGISGR
jgi:rod shape determining protein RodA